MTIEIEKWATRVVAFDTNAYRALTYDANPVEAVRRTERLLDAERAGGIRPLASTVVLMELLAHLGSPEDPSYEACKSAICAAARHCRMHFASGEYHVAIRPGTDLQLCIALWDEWPDALSHSDDMIRAIALRISEDPSEVAMEQMRPDLRRVSEVMVKTERTFAEGTRAYLMPQIEASAKELGLAADTGDLRTASLAYLETEQARELVAEAHVLRARDHTAIEETAEETRERARFVAKDFEAGIRLYVAMMKKILRSNWDLTKGGKGANLLWDMQVAFLVGKNFTVQGRPVSLVSGDRAIVDAASEAGLGEDVMSLDAYRERL